MLLFVSLTHSLKLLSSRRNSESNSSPSLIILLGAFIISCSSSWSFSFVSKLEISILLLFAILFTAGNSYVFMQVSLDSILVSSKASGLSSRLPFILLISMFEVSINPSADALVPWIINFLSLSFVLAGFWLSVSSCRLEGLSWTG